MPNIIPPIVSSSPPPMDPLGDDDNDEDDDFGDFAAADFSAHEDTILPKMGISSSSWGPPIQKMSPYGAGNYENGKSVVSMASDSMQNQDLDVTGEDEEVLRHMDSTSQDSVSGASAGSGVTDSGLCSTSQNSDVPSPMPQTEVDDDLGHRISGTDELSANHRISENESVNGSNVCEINSIHTGVEESSKHANHEVNGLMTDQSRSLETSVSSVHETQLRCQDRTDSDSPDEKSCSLHCTNTAGEKSDSKITTFFMGRSSPPSLDLKDDCNEDHNEEFGQWNSVCTEISEEKISFSSTSYCQDVKPDRSIPSAVSSVTLAVRPSDPQESDGEDELVDAMIVPDIPLDSTDYPYLDDTTSRESALALGDDEFNQCGELDSPSRRPTLVLSDDHEEFGMFVKSESELGQTLETDHETQQNCRVSHDGGPADALDDFTAFDSNGVLKCAVNTDEDLDAFADFSQADAPVLEETISDGWAVALNSQAVSVPVETSELDDFDDFESAEFQSAGPETSDQYAVPSVDVSNIQARLPELLKVLFPPPEDYEEYISGNNVTGAGPSGSVLDAEDSSVWQALRDLEATPSLTFQWPGSHGNRGLLGALNIDSRNILFGPKWNTVVPRFAANLGFSPLEPVRAVQTQPQPEPPRADPLPPQIVIPSKPSVPPSGFQEQVPAAQFDWSDSGLINPLDSNKADPSGSSLATTTASGTPLMSSAPLQVERLLASTKTTSPTSGIGEKKVRDPSLSPEAVRILDSLPELAFLSARMLMFPVQSDSSAHKL